MTQSALAVPGGTTFWASRVASLDVRGRATTFAVGGSRQHHVGELGGRVCEDVDREEEGHRLEGTGSEVPVREVG